MLGVVDGRSERLDLFGVLLGPVPWLDQATGRPAHALVLGAGAFSMLAVALTTVAAAATSGAFGRLHLALFSAVLVGLLLILLFPEVGVIFGFAITGGSAPSPVVVAIARAVAIVGVIALSVHAYGSLQPLMLAALGIPAGAEIAVTLNLLGVELSPLRLWRRFLLSTAHLGALTGGTLIAAFPFTNASPGLALAVLVSVEMAAAVVTLGVAVFGPLLKKARRDERERLEGARAAAHRERAHWLHDDVCSEIGYLRLELDAGMRDPSALRAKLSELDHRLRLRQLAEILHSGRARLGEVVQPYIRTAQARGVDVVEVPSFEVGSLVLDRDTGRYVQRTFAVLVANALHAGARTLSMRVNVDDNRLVIEIEDDAGGFDFSVVIPGRGLDGLRHEIGSSRLQLARTTQGTLARVSLDIPPVSTP